MPDAKKSSKSTPQESPILTFMKEAMNIPEYRQMMDYLQQRRATPDIEKTPQNLGPGVYGAFERNTPFGNELSKNGKISMSRSAGTDTLVHEMTHAVNYQMAVQNSEEPFNRMTQPKKSQFGEAYSKLRWDSYERDPKKMNKIDQQIETISPKISEVLKEYRLSSGEAPAFAMARHLTDPEAQGAGQTRAPDHIDATQATEFMILLDLAQREQAKKPQSQGR